MTFAIVLVCVANLLVGTLIGIAGIAGFLLPIIFTGFLGFPLTDALALSFVSFLTSGILGTWSYKKSGNLDMHLAFPLCVGSIIGAFMGVKLNLIIPVFTAKILLYIVVLLSGISVLARKENAGTLTETSKLLGNKWFLIAMGFVTAAICALTGAGGPILIVPLLAAFGVNMRVAVGVSLLNSIAIALPACVGYLAKADSPNLPVFIIASILFHGVGVLLGAKISHKVNLKLLRLLVGSLAIGASSYMLFTLFRSA